MSASATTPTELPVSSTVEITVSEAGALPEAGALVEVPAGESVLTVPESDNAHPVVPRPAGGFTISKVTSVASPTALSQTPDGRILIASQLGTVWVHTGSTLVATPALNLGPRVCLDGERGILGLDVDPLFATNRFVYLMYTAKVGGVCGKSAVNRVSRFVLAPNNVINPTSEFVLIDNIKNYGAFHGAGDVKFGPDGLLYVSTGDGGCDYAQDSGCGALNDASRDDNQLLGKVLRITRHGAIPAGNPFTGPKSARCNVAGATVPSARCQEIFARGFRNPFRIATNAANGTIFVNDVGQSQWEEVDRLTAGADYGWNVREARCAPGSSTLCGPPPLGMTNPIFSYHHSSGCRSITGGAFAPAGWSPTTGGAYLYGDYVCGRLFVLKRVGSVWESSLLASDLGEGGPIALEFVNLQGTNSLLYSSYANGGEVWKVTYTAAANRVPTAAFVPGSSAGPAPLSISFDATASLDPDGEALTYLWSWGDGTPSVTTNSPTVAHDFTTAGTRTVTLRVRDGSGAMSQAVTTTVRTGNRPPVVTITSPIVGATAGVGQLVTVSATATDPDGSVLSGANMVWTITRRHLDHDHPYVGPRGGNNFTFRTSPPEDLDAVATSSWEITVTVTDPQGASTTVHRTLNPQVVPVTLSASPAGASIEVEERSVTGTASVANWAGNTMHLNAPDQIIDGTAYTLASWSNGGTASQTLVVSPGLSLTATFVPVGPGKGVSAQYFNAADLTGPSVTRSESTINAVFSGSPIPGIDPTTFSVRWTATITPRFAETYTFITTSDDGVRVWIDGQLIIDNWTDHGAIEDRGLIALSPGPHQLQVEYYNGQAGGTAQLRWSSLSQPREIVPMSRMVPDFGP